MTGEDAGAEALSPRQGTSLGKFNFYRKLSLFSSPFSLRELIPLLVMTLGGWEGDEIRTRKDGTKEAGE